MATTFPTSTYPLLQDAKAGELSSGVIRIKLTDGTPHLWDVSSEQWQTAPLKFAPLDADDASSLLQYLYDNKATLFDVEQHGTTIQGYVWSEPQRVMKDNQWWITVDFYGRKTS